MAGDSFVFDWTKRLGFTDNPFQPELPGDINKFFAGYEKERTNTNLFVLERFQFGTIEGDSGVGKTTMLKWLEEQLKEHKDVVKVAYIDAAELKRERDLIVQLTDPILNVYEKTVSKPQNKLRIEDVGRFIYNKLGRKRYLLILIDNIGKLPKRYVSLFKYLFENKLNVQLIAAGSRQDINNSGILAVAAKDDLRVTLKGLTYEDAREMLVRRIEHNGGEDIYPFQESMIKKLYQNSDGDPKKFLLLARERVIKLSLNQKYMKEQVEKLQTVKKKRVADEVKKKDSVVPEGRMISIKLGGSDDEPKGEKKPRLGFLKAPGASEQEELLAEMVGEEIKIPKPKVEYKDAEEQLIPLEFETVEIKKKEEVIEPEKKVKAEKPKRKTKKAKEAEELLSQLAREFENL